mgnify:CR=1 FL=1
MIDKNIFKKTFLYLALLETISIAVFYLPSIQDIVFFLLCLSFLFLSLKNFKIAALIIVLELIIGSKSGDLFFLDLSGITLSVRIAFWLIFLSVFLSKNLIDLLKGNRQILEIIKEPWFKYIMVLFIFILWGLLNAVYNHNQFFNLFFDINAWFYFLLVLPFYSVYKELKSEGQWTLNSFFTVILSAIIWISTKTLIILFLFAHKLEFINTGLYTWIRKTGVGEITQMQGGFYRVFFQSHIFVLLALLAFFYIAIRVLSNKEKNWKNDKSEIIFMTCIFMILVMTTIVSLSRSNWVGLIVALGLVFVFAVWQYRLKGLVNFILVTVISLLVSMALIVLLVKFPYPKPIGGFATADLIGNRATEVKTEAGVSSRWNLLPELWDEISDQPLLGKGYGTTVTYISNDPRVREKSLDGEYTTYAFEWGWLDTWLKIGLFGVVSYIVFLIYLCLDSFFLFLKNKKNIAPIILLTSIVLVSAINFFSPYLNHPIGIGTILVLMFLLSFYKDKDFKNTT